jgi:hypothetical protein
MATLTAEAVTPLSVPATVRASEDDLPPFWD